MHIKASASIRNNYNEIANLCKNTGDPVYLTKNGEGDLVVMDIKAFERRAEELKIAEELFRVRSARMSGARGYSVSEIGETLYKTIYEISKDTIFVDYILDCRQKNNGVFL